MTEDEEFYVMELRQRERDYMQIAKKQGEKFARDYAHLTPDMTLRKAFELGYRFGLSDRDS